MNAPPLTLSLLRLSPQTLLIPDPENPPASSPIPSTPTDSVPPPDLLSPTHNYPAPFPAASLGSRLAVLVDLRNGSDKGVLGVRMMCEVQSPGARTRLGEVVHGEEDEREGGPEPPTQEQAGQGEESGDKPAMEGKEVEQVKETVPTSLSEMKSGENVRLDVSTEIKEMGMHILICSVAWETPDGRRTFQRFLRFNVTAPMAIKTRINVPTNPNSALDLVKREQVFLEIQMKNISLEGMMFDKIFMETIRGLSSRSIESSTKESKDVAEDVEKTTLMPGDTRQHSFILSPNAQTGPTASPVDPSSSIPTSPAPNDLPDPSESPPKVKILPRSTFPPTYPPGSILPLGRLDVSWRSGPAHDPGRLQTSTLNRRAPPGPLLTLPPNPASAGPSSPPLTQGDWSNDARLDDAKEEMRWEFDLVVLDIDRTGVDVDHEFSMKLRLAIRSPSIDDDEDTEPEPPPSLYLGIQYLSHPAPAPTKLLLGLTYPISPQSRSSTPSVRGPAGLSDTPVSRSSTTVPPAPTLSRSSTMGGPSSRSFTPYSNIASPDQSASPITNQLRRAVNQSIQSHTPPPMHHAAFPQAPMEDSPRASFPPPPLLSASIMSTEMQNGTQTTDPPPLMSGRVLHLGSSLVLLKPKEWTFVEEATGVTYTDPIAPVRRWEATHEVTWRFLALDEGLADLGGLRALVMEDESGLRGMTGREWESLGDVWVVDGCEAP